MSLFSSKNTHTQRGISFFSPTDKILYFEQATKPEHMFNTKRNDNVYYLKTHKKW